MATDFRVVIPADLGSTIVLGAKEPNKYDVAKDALGISEVTEVHLQGTTLQVTTTTGVKSVDLAPILPQVTAEIFLKSVTKQGNELVFVVGEKNSTTNDTTLRIDVADLLPVKSDGVTIGGTGVETDKLAVKVSTATSGNLVKVATDGLYVSATDVANAVPKPTRDIRLVNATGTTVVGYIYSSES